MLPPMNDSYLQHINSLKFFFEFCYKLFLLGLIYYLLIFQVTLTSRPQIFYMLCAASGMVLHFQVILMSHSSLYIAKQCNLMAAKEKLNMLFKFFLI
jgi:hypothetical protein